MEVFEGKRGVETVKWTTASVRCSSRWSKLELCMFSGISTDGLGLGRGFSCTVLAWHVWALSLIPQHQEQHKTKNAHKLGVVAGAFHPNAWETEARGSHWQLEAGGPVPENKHKDWLGFCFLVDWWRTGWEAEREGRVSILPAAQRSSIERDRGSVVFIQRVGAEEGLTQISTYYL